MAHKKGMGSSKNGRDSNPKMLGTKRAKWSVCFESTIYQL